MNNLKLNFINGAIVSAVAAILIMLPLSAANFASTLANHQNNVAVTQSQTAMMEQ